MQERQRDVAALDAKYSRELADARAENETLRADVAAGRKRLRINATCSGTVREATGTSGVDNATGLKVDTLSQQTLPQGTKWQDWRERKGELFQAVRMEKNMMGLLLSLIVAVAAFNIITSLGLMVMEKQGEVAILQTHQ